MNKIKIDKIICNICDKVLPSKRSYAGHMRLAHGIIVGEKQELKNKIKYLQEQNDKLLKEYDKLKEFLKFQAGKCSICGEPLNWDLSDNQERQQIIKIVEEGTKTWYHTKCKKG
jgi:uncharacterized C2H2 Zn-finger protein